MGPNDTGETRGTGWTFSGFVDFDTCSSPLIGLLPPSLPLRECDEDMTLSWLTPGVKLENIRWTAEGG